MLLFIKVASRVALYGALIGVILSACTTINILREQASNLTYVDSSFTEYVKSFQREGARRGIKVDTKQLTMIFGEVGFNGPYTVGTCLHVAGKPLITINRLYWDAVSHLDREQVAFHELGHCLLMRPHCDHKNTMMGTDTIAEPIYKERRGALIDELFKPLSECRNASLYMSKFLSF